ncbi:MAG: hydroxymethylbilane synthase [Planctomycetota bacterium]
MRIRIGTRQSPLALWQANYVSGLLQAQGVDVELVKITTAGDVSTAPLGASGGVGLFTKEIQRALLDGRCDLAVHSLKDLPTETVPGLELAAVPPREDPSDCWVAREHQTLDGLPAGSRVGTGSPRRRAQLLHLRPDLAIHDIRGNVDTRLRKLHEGEFDAIVLAYAGLHRLGFESVITEKLTLDRMLPAVGQAALGLETRSEDHVTTAAVRKLNHDATLAAVRAERELLRQLRAGCLAPVAAHAFIASDRLHMQCRVFSVDGQTMHRAEHSVDFDASRAITSGVPLALAVQVAAELTQQGADTCIATSRATPIIF